jgi:hypothetical protein
VPSEPESRIGRPEIADEIVSTMKSAGYDGRETDPFAAEHTFLHVTASPIVGRMQAMWGSIREGVVTSFREAPGLPKNKQEYLRAVDDI